MNACVGCKQLSRENYKLRPEFIESDRHNGDEWMELQFCRKWSKREKKNGETLKCRSCTAQKMCPTFQLMVRNSVRFGAALVNNFYWIRARFQRMKYFSGHFLLSYRLLVLLLALVLLKLQGRAKRCNYSNDVPFIYCAECEACTLLFFGDAHWRRHFIFVHHFSLLPFLWVCVQIDASKGFRTKMWINVCFEFIRNRFIGRCVSWFLPHCRIRHTRHFAYKCTTNACIRLDETNSRMNDGKCM